MARDHGIAIGFAVIPAKAGIPSSSARVHSNQPFPVQFGEQVGEALRGLVGGHVVLFFEGGANFADGLALFQPLPDEAAQAPLKRDLLKLGLTRI